jgi:hypothetical protein
VLCLTVVPLPPGEKQFAVKINNNNIIIIIKWAIVKPIEEGWGYSYTFHILLESKKGYVRLFSNKI